jgi:asparaginyl-tRNA synthetase
MQDNLAPQAAAFVATCNVKLHSGAGVGMARVAQFILGQKDIRACVPFLINRDNVI